jgi:hypothetical protein
MIRLSAQTLKIFKYFSLLNQSIVVKAGNELTTTTPAKNVVASYSATEKFEPFAVYDLSRWLAVTSLFDTPIVEFESGYMNIKEGNGEKGLRQVRYTYADPSMIVSPPDKGIIMPEPDCTFQLTEANLSAIQKAASILQAPEIAVSARNGTLFIETYDAKNKDSDRFSIPVANTVEPEEEYTKVFKCDNLRFVPTSYLVQISHKGIAQFKAGNEYETLKYFVAVEA